LYHDISNLIKEIEREVSKQLPQSIAVHKKRQPKLPDILL